MRNLSAHELTLIGGGTDDDGGEEEVIITHPGEDDDEDWEDDEYDDSGDGDDGDGEGDGGGDPPEPPADPLTILEKVLQAVGAITGGYGEREARVANNFNPSEPHAKIQSGDMFGWLVEGGDIFLDTDGNDKPDAWIKFDDEGTWLNVGDGWEQISNENEAENGGIDFTVLGS